MTKFLAEGKLKFFLTIELRASKLKNENVCISNVGFKGENVKRDIESIRSWVCTEDVKT